ncbi:DUF4328 domain-containing protein [Yinghuangia seranimata]|uniref:DUF4328 domain-containing protein n=1 Tax=Yinghuangia seranimata TaxID=408067 RepID=UPI00248C538F|nr:DUF4328 domain-containing protein [Yinghuangia seranimata]MDI2124913.1 DUF4328 domain-containing protein [Yinghuangia seranimata]
MPPMPAVPGYGYGAPAAWVVPKPLRTLATWTMILLGASGVMSLISAIAFQRRANAIKDLSEGRFFGWDPDKYDHFVSGSLGVTALVGIPTVVLFMIWFFRARSNVEAWVGPRPQMTRGWAIGGWFIPLANLVIPQIVANDVWNGSDPQARPDARSSNKGLLWAWWLTLCGSYVIFVIGIAQEKSADDVRNGDATVSEYIDSVRLGDEMAALGSTVRIAAAVLAILVVRKITRMQEIRVMSPGGVPMMAGPGYPGAYAPGMPPAAYPGQPYAAQPYPGQPYAGQPYAPAAGYAPVPGPAAAVPPQGEPLGPPTPGTPGDDGPVDLSKR